LLLNIDDGIVFDPSSIQVSDIAEFKAYPGVRVIALAYLERTRISITIDIGFGDEIVPARTKINFPVLLDDLRPSVHTYSIESVIT